MKAKNTFYSFLLLLVFLLFLFGSAGLFADETLSAADLRTKLIVTAKQYVGVPYRYGGLTKDGMDCSGFVYTAVREGTGVQLPRTSSAMYKFVKIVPDDLKEPGDILFFKTTGAGISHAGLYIGNNQFIHAVSDGAITGVIVSSLNQIGWKNNYVGCGQFLPPAKRTEQDERLRTEGNGKTTAPSAVAPPVPLSSSKKNTAVDSRDPTANGGSAGSSFLANSVFDFSAAMLWNFFSTDDFLFNARGASISTNWRFSKWNIEPGLGFDFRIEPRMKIFQILLLFSITVPYGFRLFMGPVFTIGKPQLIGNGDPVAAPIFLGTIGLSWQSPGIKAGKTEISFIQDISWTVFTEPDNSLLSFARAAAAGLVFSTGIRVTLFGAKLLK